MLGLNRQRGSGFLSSLKRFVIPLAKRALPHVVGAISDIASGGGVGESLKKRAADAGSDALHDIADRVAPSAKRRKPNPQKRRGSVKKRGKPSRKSWK